MFSGFTSRCTTPARCAAPSAAHPSRTSAATWRVSRGRSTAARRQVAARQLLHHQERRAVLQFAGVVEADDTRVLDAGHRPGFPLESVLHAPVVEVFGADQLDGHLAPQRSSWAASTMPMPPWPSTRRKR